MSPKLSATNEEVKRYGGYPGEPMFVIFWVLGAFMVVGTVTVGALPAWRDLGLSLSMVAAIVLVKSLESRIPQWFRNDVVEVCARQRRGWAQHRRLLRRAVTERFGTADVLAVGLLEWDREGENEYAPFVQLTSRRRYVLGPQCAKWEGLLVVGDFLRALDLEGCPSVLVNSSGVSVSGPGRKNPPPGSNG
jgi:hypothetical protein